jgi:hypothetical protein
MVCGKPERLPQIFCSVKLGLTNATASMASALMRGQDRLQERLDQTVELVEALLDPGKAVIYLVEALFEVLDQHVYAQVDLFFD